MPTLKGLHNAACLVEPLQGSGGSFLTVTQGGGGARKTRVALPWATMCNAFGVNWVPKPKLVMAGHGEKEDHTEDCGEEGSTSKALGEGGFGRWADGVRVGEEPVEFMKVGKEVVPGMRLRYIFRGHTDTIGRIEWAHCGRFIASRSEDETTRIWDANDGECLVIQSGANV